MQLNLDASQDRAVKQMYHALAQHTPAEIDECLLFVANNCQLPRQTTVYSLQMQEKMRLAKLAQAEQPATALCAIKPPMRSLHEEWNDPRERRIREGYVADEKKQTEADALAQAQEGVR